jgi:phage terminase small subunit
MTAYEQLSERQRKFVDGYLQHGNATEACRQAGYTWPEKQSHQQLGKTRIQAALAERRAALIRTYDVTPERVIAELALIAFSDMYDYVTWGPEGVTLRDSQTLDARARRVVGEVSQTITLAGGTVKFKLHSKVDALDKLARHLDLYGDKAAMDAFGQGLMDLLTRTRTAHTNGHQPVS